MATADPATPATMTLDRADGSATIELYRAALGPVHADYYLKAFTRFDAAGKPGPSWNWTAALLTLNWLLFRKLWTAALAYVGAVAGSLLLLIGIGRLVFQLSETSQWALLGFALLLTLLVPGAMGNAWLFRASNKKMEAALTASDTLEQACALLRTQASGRQHMGRLGACNLALFGLVAAAILSWPNTAAMPLNTSKMEQAKASRIADVQSGLAAQSVAAANAAATPASAAALPASAASAASTAMAAASPASAPASVPMPMPMPAVATTASNARPSAPTRSSQGLVQALPTVAVVVAASPIASAPMPAKASEPEPVQPSQAELRAFAKKEKQAAAKAAQVAKEAQKSKEALATKAAAAATPATPSTPALAGKVLINVGLFADANNARRAYAKLQDAGLPAISQEIKSAKGVRTRVRVGPFENQADAESAAEIVRALQLDAAVVKP